MTDKTEPVECAGDVYSVNQRIHGGVEVLEQEEGGDDDEHKEEGVVVEDREGGGLVVSDLIFLPQDPKRHRKKPVNHQ